MQLLLHVIYIILNEILVGTPKIITIDILVKLAYTNHRNILKQIYIRKGDTIWEIIWLV